ncbi:MAG: C39 family peptidase [Candidatus Limnocylindrales bacterium]
MVPRFGPIGTGKGESTQVGPLVLTPAEQAIVDLRAQIVADYASMRAGKLDKVTFDTENAAFLSDHGGFSAAQVAALESAPLLATNTLSMVQSAQTTTYYCGPATAYEMLKYLGASGPAGESLSQPHMANKCSDGYLCTDKLGNTPWHYYSGYPHPMVSTLNAWMTQPMWYAPFQGSSNYVSWLVYDIDYSHPVAANVYEKASSATPHLVGHPTNQVIEHWVAVRGYASSGAQSNYADSVHGTTFWSWSKNVPPYSTIASGQTGMSYMMDTIPYGYVG